MQRVTILNPPPSLTLRVTILDSPPSLTLRVTILKVHHGQ